MTYLISKLIETERVGEGLTAGLKGEGNFDVTLEIRRSVMINALLQE